MIDSFRILGLKLPFQETRWSTEGNFTLDQHNNSGSQAYQLRSLK